MKDEEVLALLGRSVREEQAHDTALVDVARGARAPASVGEEPREEDVRAMAEASRPLGEAFEAKVAARAVAALAPAEQPRPRSLALRRVARYAGPLALAAAVLVYVGARRGPDGEPTLPDYAVTARGDQTMRGDEPVRDARLRVAGDASTFEIVLRPAVVASGRIEAWVFTVAEPAGEPAPLAADVEVSPQGAVRIRGRGAALANARDVRVVLAPEGAAKLAAAASRARSGTSDARVRVVVVPVER